MKTLVQVSLLAVLTAIAVMTGGANAADEAATIRMVPESISLQPGLASQDVALVVQVPAKTTMVDAKLSWVNSPGLDIVTKRQPTFPATSDLIWTLGVSAPPNIAKDTVIAFVLEYQLKPEDGPVRSAVATLKTAVSYAGLSIAQSVKVTVEHGFDALTPKSPRPAFVVIDNSGAESMTLQSLAPQQPSYLTVRPCFRDKKAKDAKAAVPDCKVLPLTIPGRSVVRVPVEFEADPSLPPGTLHVLLNLAFSRGDGAKPETATIGVADKVEAGIPGFSEIKTALQIPSLFFLPGVLVVLTLGLIWTLSHRGANAPAFPLPAREGHFYLVSISLSLAICWAYARFVLEQEHGLIEAFSLNDVATIWFGSIILGVVLYVIGASIRPLVSRAKQLWIDKFNPKDTDLPLAILRKIALNRRPLKLQTYTSGAQRVFELGFGSPDAQKVWAISKIVLELRDEARGLEPQLTDLLDRSDLAGLQRFLDREAGHYDIGWGGQAPFDRPALVARTDLSAPRGRQNVVELQ